MSKNKIFTFAIVTSVIALSIIRMPPKANAWIGRMDNQASSVIGQVDFEGTSENQGGSIQAYTLRRPRGVWESEGRLAISDWMNNRILIFNTIPTTNNPSADVVIGQQNFTSGSANQGSTVKANTLSQPGGISGGDGKFLVTDNSNNRVLIFDGLPTESNASANLVIGQPDFTHNSYTGPTASSMNIPEDGWTDGTKVIVADRSNNRVLIWNTMPTSNGQAADVVIGQTNFTSNLANQGGAAGANTLNLPNGVASDGTRLFIADSGNARVLIYNHFPTADNHPADVVVGQPNFTDTSPNQGLDHPEAYTLGPSDSPQRVYSEGTRLYVCDKGNQRILIYNTIPTENNASADAVFGQSDFVSSGAKTGAGGISSPRSIFAGSTQFYVTDRSYNRVLVFKLAPQNTALAINGGATETKNRAVNLSISATGSYQMAISNTSDFSGLTQQALPGREKSFSAGWESYSDTKEWELDDKPGEKTVYIKFRDYALFESAVLSAMITYNPDIISPSPTTSASTSSSATAQTQAADNILPETGYWNPFVLTRFYAIELAKIILTRIGSIISI